MIKNGHFLAAECENPSEPSTSYPSTTQMSWSAYRLIQTFGIVGNIGERNAEITKTKHDHSTFN
jgi:hypothetical protein